MKFYSKILALLLIFLGQEALSAITQITNFRLAVYPDKTRLVLDTTGKVSYTSTHLADKITVDIKKAVLKAQFKKINLAKTPVNSISSIQNRNNLYLTLQLKKPIKLHHFFLSKPDRLVLDLYPVEKKEPIVIIKQADSLSSDEQQLPQAQQKISPPKPQKKMVSEPSILLDDLEQDLIKKISKVDNQEEVLRPVVIVIDPGHGGMDTGTIGYEGTREKDVNLGVAKALQKIIGETKGFRVVLTRDKDYFIPLRGRLGIAHSHKADLFVSVHADAYKNRDAHGASVFALSQRGATSEAARWLADKENESELGQAISDKNTLLRSVLIDLAQTATISSGLEVGGKILKALSSIASLHSKEVEQAAFVVLKSPDIPSLIVEVGFLSNAAEEARLSDVKYQEEIAVKIASGIQSYFIRHPPPRTYLANIKRHSDTKPATLRDSLPGGSY